MTPTRATARCSREVADFGKVAGSELMALGFTANEHKPRFRPYDADRNRIDEIEFHPAYHRIMQLAVAHGVPSFA